MSVDWEATSFSMSVESVVQAAIYKEINHKMENVESFQINFIRGIPDQFCQAK